jgi:hypothetical protein
MRVVRQLIVLVMLLSGVLLFPHSATAQPGDLADVLLLPFDLGDGWVAVPFDFPESEGSDPPGMQFAGAALVPASFLEALEEVGIDGTAMVSTPPETIVEALGPERLGELAPQWVVIGTMVYAGDRALPVSLFELISDTLEVQTEADALAVDGPPLGARTYWAGWARDVEGVTFLGFAAGFWQAGRIGWVFVSGPEDAVSVEWTAELATILRDRLVEW